MLLRPNQLQVIDAVGYEGAKLQACRVFAVVYRCELLHRLNIPFVRQYSTMVSAVADPTSGNSSSSSKSAVLMLIFSEPWASSSSEAP